jgi:hypothetical protein
METQGMDLNPVSAFVAQAFAVGMMSVVVTFPAPSDLAQWLQPEPPAPVSLSFELPDPEVLPEGGCLSKPKVSMTAEARAACAGLLGAVFTEIDASPEMLNQTWVTPVVEEIRSSALHHCRRVWATGGADAVAQSASCRLATQDVAFTGRFE